MRILFDEQIFSNQRFGGISRYYSELVKALGTKDDVTAKLVSPLCTNHYAKNTPRSYRVGIPLPVMSGSETFLWHFNRETGGTTPTLPMCWRGSWRWLAANLWTNCWSRTSSRRWAWVIQVFMFPMINNIGCCRFLV